MNAAEKGKVIKLANIPVYPNRGENTEWKIIGPGGGGSMFTPTISPHDQDTVMIACDMTGSYMTQDGGKQWSKYNFQNWAKDFAFDPNDPNTIYAGSSGLYRSTDKGLSWQVVFPRPDAIIEEIFAGDHGEHSFISTDNWPGGEIRAIAIDPGNSERIALAIYPFKKQDAHPEPRIEIYVSSDYGSSWDKLAHVQGEVLVKLFVNPYSPLAQRELVIFTECGAHTVSISAASPLQKFSVPEHTDQIFDVTMGKDPLSNGLIFYIIAGSKLSGDAQTRIYKTADFGSTWKRLHSGLYDDMSTGQTREFKHVAACSDNACVVYACARHPRNNELPNVVGPYHYGFLKSVDQGETWEWVMKISDKQHPANKTEGWMETKYEPEWEGSAHGMDVHAVNGDVCYISNWGTVFRTVDGGMNWEQLYCHAYPDGSYGTSGLDVTTTYGVHFDPFDPSHIAISYTDIGLFHSHNTGESWKHAISGIPSEWINTCYWLTFDPEVRGRVWSVWSNCHDLPRPKMLRRGSLLTRYVGGVSKSDDGMESWRTIHNGGMPENSVPTHIVLDPNSPVGQRTLYTAVFQRGVYKSMDDGETWELKNEGIQGNLNAWKLVLQPNGTLYLIVARGFLEGKEIDGAIYKSIDGAEHWHPVSLPEGVNFPNNLAYDPEELQRLYIACWPRTIDRIEKHGGVYVSENGGESWRLIFDDAAHVYGIHAGYSAGSPLFISTFESKVYRSDDRGETWGSLNGYDFKWGHEVIPDPHHQGMIYVTTFGSSVMHGPYGEKLTQHLLRDNLAMMSPS